MNLLRAATLFGKPAIAATIRHRGKSKKSHARS